MRLIDADEFPTKHVDTGFDDYGIGFDEGAQAILDEIKDAPTIDAVPVIHGHWKQDENKRYRCSNCQAVKDQYYDWFCSYCGAKMDGKLEWR